ncbi:hypothetical protein SAY87_018950 [Trapa incisa]|uniref:Protein kinase domain-containing protein n=1 Tax=Trapa incisa TaxID=236973 RepID=A0AAN7K3Q8_9MYRT|nr:hypothetical protein SAY87_018950 [Trapa incisa]
MTRLLVLFCFFSLSPLLVKPLSLSLNDDVLGLIVFKADVQDPTGKLASWDEDDDSACGWAGVKCNSRSNQVVELNLDGFSLSGRLGRGLLQLKSLRKLSLAKNNLTGSINANFARLDNLRILDLSENGLSGSVPDELFQQCGSLKSVSFARNKLSGEIPKSLTRCSSLVSLNLSSNQFSGPLPEGIWSLSAIRVLDLSRNALEDGINESIQRMKNLRALTLKGNRMYGAVPGGIGSCLLLRSIDLSENSFSGSLPDTFSQLTLCNYLDLHGNSFSGEIPESIGEVRALETLDLSDNAFSGKLPTSLGNLVSLKVLNLSGNSLSGPLPESMSSCQSLQVADFSWNSFTGGLPDWIFKGRLQELQTLDLSSNFFTNQIPTDFGDLSGLQFLNLSNNSLTGSVPKGIGMLKKIDVLDLSDNRLNGSIPSEVGGAGSLKELWLQNNELTGNIPASMDKCYSLTTLLLSHNYLSGPIPSSMSRLGNLQIVDLSYNNLSGSLPKQLANLAHLLTFNISHNQLQGQLPLGGFFNTISPSSVSENPSLCGAPVNRSCPGVLPKPIVLNPNSTGDTVSGSFPPPLGRKRIILSISALIAIGAAGMIVIGVIAITVLNLRVQSISASRSAAALTFSGVGDELFSESPGTDANSGKLVMFSTVDPDFSTGAHALLNKDCELGRGGFGAVYRTILRDDHPVAIKKLTVSSLVKSQDDFEREVKKLGKVRHPNIVALEGYYWTPSLQLLISEFVSGGSLYKHLHEASAGDSKSSLSWNDRFNIILGTAKGLAHLHQTNIIHYNIKSSNVLIDSSSGDPKVADFGLARLLPMLDRYVLSSKIQSALGYMAPEFACRTVKITEKCDVYGFGVLVLEIVAGKRPVEYMEDDVVVLCEMVRGSLEDGRVEECVDGELKGNYPAEEAIPVMKLGLICTSQVPSNRPDMAEVVKILELIRCPSEGMEEELV